MRNTFIRWLGGTPKAWSKTERWYLERIEQLEYEAEQSKRRQIMRRDGINADLTRLIQYVERIRELVASHEVGYKPTITLADIEGIASKLVCGKEFPIEQQLAAAQIGSDSMIHADKY